MKISMKKLYITPCIYVFGVECGAHLLSGSDGQTLHKENEVFKNVEESEANLANPYEDNLSKGNDCWDDDDW